MTGHRGRHEAGGTTRRRRRREDERAMGGRAGGRCPDADRAAAVRSVGRSPTDDGVRDGAATDATGTVGTTADAEPPRPSSCEVGETDGDLLFYNWSDYMDPDLIDAFEEEYGVSVTEDFYTSNEALLAQIRAGGADYDVIVPSDYMVEIMIEEGLLLPLDTTRSRTRQRRRRVRRPALRPGPRVLDALPVGHHRDRRRPRGRRRRPEPTWGWLFDPEVAGRAARAISMLDDPRETMGAALYYLGYDPNTTDEAELQEAADLIAEARLDADVHLRPVLRAAADRRDRRRPRLQRQLPRQLLGPTTRTATPT
jgi:hypothetical protein